MTTALAIQPQQQGMGTWLTADQQKIVRDSLLGGASAEEAAVLMEAARSLGLNPLLKQIHFVKRFDNRKNRDVWAFQVGIDGFRSIAEDSGEYDGQDAPEWVEGDGHPIKCTIKIYRKGVTRPFVGEAYWDEYVQTVSGGKPNSMWSRGKHFMLAKCAEAIALRKAFPRKLSGVYIPEEIREEKDATPALPRGVDAIPSSTKKAAEKGVKESKAAQAQLASLSFEHLSDQLDANRAWLESAKPEDPRRAVAEAKCQAIEEELALRASNGVLEEAPPV